MQKFDFRLWGVTVGVDLLSWLVILILYSMAQGLIFSQADQVQLPESLADLSENQAKELRGDFQVLIVQFILITAITAILVAAIWSTAKSFIWRAQLKKHFGKQFFLRSLKLGGIFLTLGILGTIFALALRPEVQQPFFLGFLFVFTYFAFTCFLQFAQKERIEGIFVSALKRWDLMLIHLGVMAALFIIQTQLLNTLGTAFQIIGTVGVFAMIGAIRPLIVRQYQKRGG